MASNENRFPTIRDLHGELGVLIERGLGDLPVQIVVAPDSTMQVLASALTGNAATNGKPSADDRTRIERLWSPSGIADFHRAARVRSPYANA